MKIKLLKLFMVYLFAFLIVPTYSLALDEINVWENDIYIETNPENPEPYQDVTVKISSYATDINKAMIEWRSGSSLLLSGYGETKYTFKASGPNTSTIIDVIITPADSYQKINKRVIVSPTIVDMLWEAADSYTPPFYRGKSLVSNEGQIKVVAIPIIKTGINNSNIVYKWKQDGSAVESKSGYNKNYYIFNNNVLKTTENLSVEVSSVNGDYSAIDNIEVPINSPKILFYKKSPTEGILYNHALVNDVFIPEDEFTIVAEPYFLAMKGKEPLFTYSWKINGSNVNTPNKKREVTLRPTSSGGYATISLIMENFNTLFQKVTGQLRITL